MIFAALIGVALPGEPMKWTGEVKAFAYYISPECLPQERMHVVYVARKLFEDGSTVTLVRSVPVGTHPTARPATMGEGWIERDAKGAATGIVTKVASTIGPRLVDASEFTLDVKNGTLKGWGTYGNGIHSSKNLTLASRTECLLDPLEGLAFGSLASLSQPWLLPAATYGYVDSRAPSVGMWLNFRPALRIAFDLNGKREMFRRFDMVRRWMGSSIAKNPEPAGSLLFHEDGTLAAYAPLYGVERLPGTSFWAGGYSKSGRRPVAPPPFELKGELAKLWEKGPDAASTNTLSLGAILGVFIPTRISAAEKSSLLAAIPDREKPVEEEKPVDGGGGQTVPPR